MYCGALTILTVTVLEYGFWFHSGVFFSLVLFPNASQSNRFGYDMKFPETLEILMKLFLFKVASVAPLPPLIALFSPLLLFPQGTI